VTALLRETESIAMNPPKGILLAPWLIPAFGFLALSVSFSARAALSLAMPIWAQAGWSLGFSSLTSALALIVMAVVAPCAGNMLDRQGPKRILICGLVAIAAGMAIISVSQQSWMLVPGFSLIGAIGFGLVAQHVVATAIAQSTMSHRGFATGIATSGSTAGQLLLVPLLAAVMQASNWRLGFLALAMSSLLLAVAIAVMLRRQPGTTARTTPSGAAPDLLPHVQALFRQPVFHALFWSFTLCGFTTTGAIETHLLPYAAWCGLPPLPSAAAYGILSGVNLLGMILVGWLTDRINRPVLLGSIYILRSLCFILLLVSNPDLKTLIIFAVAFGLVDYATVPVTASLVASHLGLRVMGLAMGLIAAGHALGGAIGAFVGGRLIDAFGNYNLLWWSSLALALLAGMMVLLRSEKANGSHAPASTAETA
jgi:predicted MFS family arabinose efflux permease